MQDQQTLFQQDSALAAFTKLALISDGSCLALPLKRIFAGVWCKIAKKTLASRLLE